MKQNNTEGFDEHQEAGGMKLSSSNDVLIDDDLADGNYGKGIWFDIASLRATIVRNQTFSNLDEGIQFEISSGAVIAGNVAWRNSGGGIRVIESQHVDIYNNVLYKNQSAVDVWEGSRPQNVADVTIRNNVMMDGSAGATALLDIHDFTNKLTGAQMGVSTDADAFCRTNSTQPPQVAAWANGAGKGQARYTSLAAFAKATGSDVHGIACDGAAAGQMLMNPPAGNFPLAAGSPGDNAGVALPSNVATALSVSPGIPVNLGLLGPGAVTGPGPTITSDPVSTSVLVGQTYTMAAAASGSPRPSVQWQVSPDGVTFTNITGATSTRYTAVAAATDNNKRFRAVFTNSGGVSISDAATLTVSTTTVSVEDPGTLVWGQPLTLVADASMSGVAAADVTGSVTFYDGSTKLGTPRRARRRRVDAGTAARCRRPQLRGHVHRGAHDGHVGPDRRADHARGHRDHLVPCGPQVDRVGFHAHDQRQGRCGEPVGGRRHHRNDQLLRQRNSPGDGRRHQCRTRRAHYVDSAERHALAHGGVRR